MPVVFACPGCSREIRTKSENAGRRSRCPYCQKALVIPNAAGGGSAGGTEDNPFDFEGQPPPSTPAAEYAQPEPKAPSRAELREDEPVGPSFFKPPVVDASHGIAGLYLAALSLVFFSTQSSSVAMGALSGNFVTIAMFVIVILSCLAFTAIGFLMSMRAKSGKTGHGYALGAIIANGFLFAFYVLTVVGSVISAIRGSGGTKLPAGFDFQLPKF
jgi:DNA-directed RNA polymerase subunit RPC12/RpoP